MRTLLILALLLVAACGSPRALTVEESEFVVRGDLTAEEAVQTDRFLGNLRDGFTDHARDCEVGLDFTTRTISRNIAENWDRFMEAFR